jgi:hypothetical protein
MTGTDVADRSGSVSPGDAPPRVGLDVSSLVRVVLPALLLGITLAVIVRGYAAPLSNSDTYFHLRFGWEFLHGWSLRDPGSVTSTGTAHWVPTQWLPEIVMARFEEWFGLPGVAWLAGLQVVAFLVALYLSARRSAEPLIAVVLVITALVGASIGLSARPQVISYLLVVVTVQAWLRTADDRRARWGLVPLAWVWAMCHGMWPVGIFLGGVALVGIALDRRTTPRRWLLLACVPAASAVVAALTPVGPELYVQELRVQQRSRFFSEWNSPTLTSHACLAVGVIAIVGVVALLRTTWRGWTPILFFVLGVVCAVWTWRTVPVAAAVLVPVTAPALQAVTRRGARPPGRREVVAVGAAGLATLLALALAVPHRVPDPTDRPGWLQPALSSLPPGTLVLSSWDTSAVLMWRFHGIQPVSHGYGDTFTVRELQRNLDIEALAPGWQRELHDARCTTAVLDPDSPLARALVRDEHWTVEHRSDGLEMLVAPTPGSG